MPELPEVETVVRGLRQPLVGHTITSVLNYRAKSLVIPSPDEFLARLPGQQVQGITRRGKYILCLLDRSALIIHLKMTGRLYVAADEAQNEADRWVQFAFQLEHAHQLRFSDARKFGRVYLVSDPEIITGKLGPEPLDPHFTFDAFAEQLAGRRGGIKALLLNQAFIAGIGNIYADEALHLSRIHPRRTAESLADSERQALYNAIRHVLSEGIRHEGASINWYRTPDGRRGEVQDYFRAYGQTGKPCPECGTPIERLTVAGRGTHICPACQPTAAANDKQGRTNAG